MLIYILTLYLKGRKSRCHGQINRKKIGKLQEEIKNAMATRLSQSWMLKWVKKKYWHVITILIHSANKPYLSLSIYYTQEAILNLLLYTYDS